MEKLLIAVQFVWKVGTGVLTTYKSSINATPPVVWSRLAQIQQPLSISPKEVVAKD